MKSPARLVPALVLAIVVALPAASQPMKESRSPRETGRVTLSELSIREGKVLFRVESNGCTDAHSFRVHVKKEGNDSAGIPRYRLTIERIVVDECKALLLDGVEIVLDLEKDLGIRGPATVSVDNPVVRASGVRADPARAMLNATIKAIGLEIDSYKGKLSTAESGTGPAGNADAFRKKLAELEDQKAEFTGMRAEDYPQPSGAESVGVSILKDPAPYGPVLPPVLRDVTASVDGKAADGTLLAVNGASKSGPFYHLAGIAGDDYSILQPGMNRRLTLCLVYRREYFGLIADYYVYVAGVQ
jgi:hypothetical protein